MALLDLLKKNVKRVQPEVLPPAVVEQPLQVEVVKNQNPGRAEIRAFQAAVMNRLNADWILSSTSQDSEIRPALNVLRSRARDLGRNNDYVRSYLSEIEKNIVGPGARLQSNVREADVSDTAANKLIETEWAKWAKKESCDVAGKLSFSLMERMLIRNTAESGEILIRFVYKRFGKSKIPFSIQIIESDHLDENFNGQHNGNDVRMGVEFSSYGRAVAYHLFDHHPGDAGLNVKSTEKKRIRVPAEEILHLFISERPGQSRGFTWLVSTVSTLRQLNGYIEAAIVKKRAQASVMGFIQSGDPETDSSDSEENGQFVDYFEAGTIKKLMPGETMNVPNLGGGTESEFDPFVQSMLRKTAAGAGSSYESISKDFSRSNYSSSRLSLMSERDLYKMIQSWFIESFHEIVFERWMEAGVLAGVFKFKDYTLNEEKYNSPKWMPRGWDWVDPAKDIEADKEALKSGLKTMSGVLARTGQDFEETILQIKKERDFMKQHGVEIDILLEMQPQNNPKIKNSTGSNPDANTTED